MRILISGATGMVGTELCAALAAQNHQVTKLVRGKAGPGEVLWNPLSGQLDATQLEGIDAVVHLAGENIAGRWTISKKKAIRESRTLGTKTLCDALMKMQTPPKVLVLSLIHI